MNSEIYAEELERENRNLAVKIEELRKSVEKLQDSNYALRNANEELRYAFEILIMSS